MFKRLKHMLSNPGVYTKFWVALAAALGVLASALADGHVTPAEWTAIAAAFIGSGFVYQLPNAS